MRHIRPWSLYAFMFGPIAASHPWDKVTSQFLIKKQTSHMSLGNIYTTKDLKPLVGHEKQAIRLRGGGV